LRSSLRRLAVVGGTVAATLIPLAAAPAPAHAAGNSVVVEITEADGAAGTGLTFSVFGSVDVTCTGTIWAGVWFTGRNGPEGWTNRLAPADHGYPMAGAPRYGVVARFRQPGGTQSGQFFYIGTHNRFGVLPPAGLTTATLDLFINDDVPGNGNGAFSCTVQDLS
jgi:hypothetical protein